MGLKNRGYMEGEKKLQMSEQRIEQLCGSETILHIEDEPTIRQTVATILARMRYVVLEAETGEAGLAIYQERACDIDLVLLDLGLPDQWGGEVFSQLRAIDPQVKVVVFTGIQGPQRNLEGMQALLEKPVRLVTLLQTVRTVLDTE